MNMGSVLNGHITGIVSHHIAGIECDRRHAQHMALSCLF